MDDVDENQPMRNMSEVKDSVVIGQAPDSIKIEPSPSEPESTVSSKPMKKKAQEHYSDL
jgi:hypothetical protein